VLGAGRRVVPEEEPPAALISVSAMSSGLSSREIAANRAVSGSYRRGMGTDDVEASAMPVPATKRHESTW
jgi:hypothetical protein